VPLPDGHCPITLKCVFKLKKDELGAVIKHKARLVACGFVQQEGIDYNNAFVPAARMVSQNRPIYKSTSTMAARKRSHCHT